MNRDPYAICPCGAGIKQKWCNAKNAMEQIDKAVGMIENNQQESSLAVLTRLAKDRSQPECFQAFATSIRVHALASFQRTEEAISAAQDAVKAFPNFGISHETLGDFPYALPDYAAALDHFYDALANYPVTAVGHACRTLLKVGACHNFQGRPFAAWAAWSSALKLDPEFNSAKEAIQHYVHDNLLLPNMAKHGIQLKPADEFTLFHEDVGEKWEQADDDGRNLHIDDLVLAFEEITSKSPSDTAAWYNYGIALAWAGENLQAIKALQKYVELEPDLDAAADAWDIAEILRLGVGAESEADCRIYSATYRVHDPKAMLTQLNTSKHILVSSDEEKQISIAWMDKEIQGTGEGAVPILGGPPRQIAALRVNGSLFEILAASQSELNSVMGQFEALVGSTVERDTVDEALAEPGLLDSEPVNCYWGPNLSDEQRRAKEADATRAFFEEKWIHKPLRSLRGMPPVDAAQSTTTRKMLEGVIRFRERLFGTRGIQYNFDRLRNKLGLPIAGGGLSDATDATKPSDAVEISAYSAAQLAALEPNKLSDEELLAAYRAALNLDAPQTAATFAREIISRDSMAEKLDVLTVFRRLAQDLLQKRQKENLLSLVQDARRYSQSHYGSREAALWDLFEARASLLEGDRDEAVSRLRSIIEHNPDRLDIAADAVESLLSVGEYASAKSIAEHGLSLAESQRNPDLQSQFRDYAREAAARV